MIKRIICRNIFLFIIIGIILAQSINFEECFIKRGKYLLGIVYNGYFLNDKDKIVYEDYLKRHGSAPDVFQKSL